MLQGEARPSEDVSLFVVEREGVLYSDVHQELHTLNTAATFVWCALEEGLDVRGVSAAYGRAFQQSPADSDAAVGSLLETWRALGVLNGSSHREVGAQARGAREERAVQRPEREPDPSASCSATRCVVRGFRLAGVRFALEFDTRLQADYVLPVFDHLPEVSPEEADARLRCVRVGRAHEVRLDGVPVASCWTLGSLAPTVKELVRQSAINSQSYFLQIHAGAIESRGGAILLPGAPGSGKTTLTGACIASGLRYLTDEVALLEENGLRVRPMPLGLTVKRGAIDLLTPAFPELMKLPEHVRQDGVRVRYLPPPEPFTDDDAVPVRQVVFPRYTPECRTELRVIGRIAALRRLMDECLSLPVALTRANVGDLISWIRQVDCYELRMASLPEAVSLVRMLTP